MLFKWNSEHEPTEMLDENSEYGTNDLSEIINLSNADFLFFDQLHSNVEQPQNNETSVISEFFVSTVPEIGILLSNRMLYCIYSLYLFIIC